MRRPSEATAWGARAVELIALAIVLATVLMVRGLADGSVEAGTGEVAIDGGDVAHLKGVLDLVRVEEEKRLPAKESSDNTGRAVTLEALEIDPDFVESLRRSMVKRISGLAEEHSRSNRPQAIGFRGVSFLHNRTGALLTMPSVLFASATNSSVAVNENGRLELLLENIARGPCNIGELHRMSIWIRLEGPEIFSGLAEPVSGKCQFRAAFNVSLSGLYTVYARLVFYNAHLSHVQHCGAVPLNGSDALWLEELFDLPTHAFHASADAEHRCCAYCARIDGCDFSLRPVPSYPGKANLTEYDRQGETRCLLFRRAVNDGALGNGSGRGFPANQVYKRYNVSAKTSPLLTDTSAASREQKKSQGVIRMLGCGRDAFLFKWVPCGSYGHLPQGALMPGTEDVVIFEASARLRVVSRQNDPTKLQDSIFVPWHKDTRPICRWSDGVPLHFGRYVRVPLNLLQGCNGTANADYHGTHMTQFDSFEPIICSSRWNLHRFRYYMVSWGPLNPDLPLPLHMHVWRSELSDSYSLVQREFIEPVSPAPVSVVYALDRRAPCRLRPWRNASEIHTCLVAKRIGKITVMGRSIARGLYHALSALLNGAFPDATLHGFYYKMPSVHLRYPGSDITRHVIVTNMQAPHIVSWRNGYNMSTAISQTVESFRLHKLGNVFRKIWFTPGFQPYERQLYQYYSRYDEMAREVQTKHLTRERGWIEIDYKPLTYAFAFDSTPESDTLHYVGPSLFELAMYVIDAMCE